MKMTNEQAIQQLQEMIDYWEFLLSTENDDKYATGLELEALCMAVQALKEKSLSEAYRED